MATEILTVPENHLLEVICVIRKGIEASPKISPVVREQLMKWCTDEEAYMLGDDAKPPPPKPKLRRRRRQ